MAEGFRIGRITVEGFKGFTETKEIDLQNRHVFLLGRNGNGKSSIVEAIRWGLFGSTGRPKDIVANRGYSGRCHVEISLSRDGKEWRLRRRLTLGAGGSSDAVLFDEDGKEHRIRAVLPQMDSLDAGEGTHIIFAPQSALLRRPPEDLTPFERTVFGHLGLTHASAMSSHLRSFVEEQEFEENDLGERLSNARTELDGRLAELERQRGRILESPPWDDDLIPSNADTERKAKKLILKISDNESETALEKLSLDTLVDKAETALQERIDANVAPLDEQLEQFDEKLIRLATIREAQGDVDTKRGELERAEERLVQALDRDSLEELQKRVESGRREADTQVLQHRLGDIARELLDRSEGDDLVSCSICGAEWKRDQLDRSLSDMVTVQNEEDSAALHAIEERFSEAQDFERDIREIGEDVKKLTSRIEEMIAFEEDVELTDSVNAGRVAEHTISVEKQRASVAAQINGFEHWSNRARTDVSNLRDEARYQTLQRKLRELNGLQADMDRVQKAFEEMITFGESVKDIHESVDSTLKEDLRKKVPRVAADLTRVFGALTEHPHFDKLVIDDEKLPRLELRVGSTNDLSGKLHPTGVLNGQAQSALELVPYFALSQADEAPTEVYLVLLDDPTRAFDRQHIEILIERLADLGNQVQVVVATQETEAFRELLPRSFDRSSYVIVEPKNWSYADGPDLVAEYE